MAYGRFSVPSELLTLSPAQVLEYSAAAESQYRPDLAYHNWGHALSVASGTEVIAEKLHAKGQTIATGALAVAAAWHDAGYHENHTAKGFATKELYSAALLDTYLENKPVGAFEKQLMRRSIIATWAGHEALRDPYELILHRADVANIGGPEDEFIASSMQLWDEHRHTADSQISWEAYVQGSAGFIHTTADEHDYESLKHLIDPLDTTIDVYDIPFAKAALHNAAVLLELEV